MSNRVEHPVTYSVTYLSMSFRGQELSSASGFFWRAYGKLYLITNWHNVTGRNPDDMTLLSKTGAVPNEVSFTVFKKESQSGDPTGYVSLMPIQAKVPLYCEDGSTPRWLEHPRFKHEVDVVAIPLDGIDEKLLQIHPANTELNDIAVEPKASQDAFVVGFPLGMITKMPIPIWKRATIATEPGVDLDGRPKLMIDTATRSGMSGSLVLAHHIILGPYKMADGTLKNSMISIQDTILGVYSGRLGQDSVQAQLGIVWKRSAIEEVVAQKELTNPFLAL